ncbi:MAG: ribbon-helix-helix protein, CopG family [Vampirovibrionales bacterium]|nr:ribbon-helix-helix protein, CopG family [Vampirovibrionales bacterium]
MSNRRKNENLVRVTFNLEKDVYAEFEVMAEEEQLSAAWLIRKAMREFLEHHSTQNRRTKA